MKTLLTNANPFTRLPALLLVAASLVVPASALAKPENGQKFQDWTAGCETPPAQNGQNIPEQCYIHQTISVKDTDNVLMRLAIGYVGKEQKPAAVVTVPLGIFLPPGFSFSIDGGKAEKFPVQFCNPSGCRGILPLSNTVVSQMKRGKQGTMLFYDGARREVGIPVSLLGFTAGFNSLK